jgi:ADP-heptose:LPS heptosyltransferase
MVKILIFRTDRIGDLIVTCPTIISLKKHFKECNITLITSNKNYEYAKSLNLFDNVIEFPKANIINKIKFIYNLNKKNFDYIFVFDGKERSILTTTFIKSKIKVALTDSIKIHYNFFKIKFFEDNEKTNLNEIFQKMLNCSGLEIIIDNYNFIKNKKNNNFSKKIPIDKYIHIHIDEKWFSHLYINSYTNINPDLNEFVDFLDNISKNDNVLITTGLVELNLIKEIIDKKIFHNNEANIFFRKINNNSIYLINKPTFEDIESLLRNSKKLISCHGAITHAANSFEIQIIDIIEKDKKLFYQRFTSYMSNYTYIYRENFNSIKRNLFNKLNE